MQTQLEVSLCITRLDHERNADTINRLNVSIIISDMKESQINWLLHINKMETNTTPKQTPDQITQRGWLKDL
jgi:hypothetical protein